MDRKQAARDWVGRTAGVLGFLGVALGAMGSHAFAERLEAAGRMETWETAVLYHLVHAVALLVLVALPEHSRRKLVAACWTAGVAVFSGSLYILCLTGVTWLGAITPLGGIAMLVGWAMLAAGAVRR